LVFHHNKSFGFVISTIHFRMSFQRVILMCHLDNSFYVGKFFWYVNSTNHLCTLSQQVISIYHCWHDLLSWMLKWLAKIPCWCNLMKWFPKMACQNYLETWITNDFQMICRDSLCNSFHLCAVHHISIRDGLNFHVHYDGKFTSTNLSIILYTTYQNYFYHECPNTCWDTLPMHIMKWLVELTNQN